MARVASQHAIEAHLRHDPQVLEGCYLVAAAVVDEAKVLAPKGEGGSRNAYGIGPVGVMAAAIRAERTASGARARSPVEWSAPNESGTGVHGPKGARVQAKPNQPMVFYARPKGGVIRSVGGVPTISHQGGGGQVQKFVLESHAGMKGNRFMSRAAEAVAASSDRLTWHPHRWSAAAP